MPRNKGLDAKRLYQSIVIAVCFSLLQLVSPIVAAQVPNLVAVAVVNSPTGFALEPSDLQFHQHQEYLLVLTNDNVENVTFFFNQFGQKLLTHYLQGTPSVSQESVDIPSKGKVLWQFSPQDSGEFDYHISDPSQNKNGATCKIIIHPIAPEEPRYPKAQQEEVIESKDDIASKKAAKKLAKKLAKKDKKSKQEVKQENTAQRTVEIRKAKWLRSHH